MGEFIITQNGGTNYTVLCNRFIDEYMAEANDAQLKIYLYLLRTVNAGKNTSISELADFFNYSEKDILRALKYWEKKKILSLSFREDKSLESLQFLSLTQEAPMEENTKQAASVKNGTPSVCLFPTVAEVPKEISFEKPQYSLDQLKEFKHQENTSRLVFIAEQYLKKTLTPTELQSILFIHDQLGFSEDLIDYLIQYCVERDKKSLRYMEKVAINWAQSHITTPKQAAKYASKHDKIVYDIMHALGKSTMPTNAEMEYINRWTKEFGYDFALISIACEKAVLATDSHRFNYANKILDSWHQAGVRNLADLSKVEQVKPVSKKTASSSASQSQFHRFDQHDYDFQALEKELLSN